MAKEILYRSSTIERKDNIDEEARTIELSFSSEAPVERAYVSVMLVCGILRLSESQCFSGELR